MKRFLLLCCMFISLSAIAKPAAPVVNIQHWKTNVGTPVYFVQSKQLPMLDINVMFAAGSAYDGAHSGLSAMMANVLGEGTSNKTADQVADGFDRVGALFQTSSDRDKLAIQLRCLTDDKYIHEAVDLFDEVISEPNFSDRVLQRIKNQTVSVIRAGEQDPGTVAAKAFYADVYKGTVYAHPVMGDVKSVEALTAAQLKAFFNQYFIAQNAKLVLVGDISVAQAKQIANKLTDRLRAGHETQPLKTITANYQGQDVHVDFPSQQTAIVVGQRGVLPDNKMRFALTVGNYVLGGMPLSSVLFNQVREKRGLAYYAISRFNMLQFRGPFMVQLKTRANQTQNAIAVVKQVLRNYIKKGPSQQQLQAAKKNLIGGFPLGLDSNSNLLSVVSSIAFYNRPLDYLDNYRARIGAVTVADVRRAFQGSLDPKQMVTVSVGPK
ncbi:MAG: insulinase family protein [Gammaproteobacteria bacterium]|nr:insulinase family protein [Gammaproteobacteria bacterium]MCH9743319.1 insulinase family protein [Gammaproteobacteria bacterium]